MGALHHSVGKPWATEPWRWQLSGHHTIVNYFDLGDQLVITPLFLGFEPVLAKSGQIQGAGDAAG
jgi:hypothetical protein